MVLRGDVRDLALRGAEPPHVITRQPGVHVHEYRPGPTAFRRRDLRRRQFRSKAGEAGQQGLRVVHIPAAFEQLEDALLVVDAHLLAADREHDLGLARAQIRGGLRQCGAGTGAGVLDVDDGNALDAGSRQRDLSSHGLLILQCTLPDVAEPRGFDIGHTAAGIGQRQPHGLGGQLAKGFFRLLAEGRHADADDKDLFSHHDLRAEAGDHGACFRF